MAHGIISTLAVAIFGLVVARLGDLSKLSLARKKNCEESNERGGVWSYNAQAAQQQGAWLRVQRPGTC
jgi:hypothetical protein